MNKSDVFTNVLDVIKILLFIVLISVMIYAGLF